MAAPSGSTMLAAALEYAARGWPVVPGHEPGADGGCTCSRGSGCPKPGKHPRSERGVDDATTDPEITRLRWRKWPTANVQIATGKVSGLLVLDVDPRHGGRESLEKLVHQHGPLPRTVRSATGGDGDHFYLAHHDVLPSRNALLPGLDVKADKGLVVAPPSLHASGKRYRWADGCSPEELELAPAPAWLVELAQAARPAQAQRVTYARSDVRELPESAREILRYDPRVRSRFLRDPHGLRDGTPSGVDFSLAIGLARWHLPGDVIEAVGVASRMRAGLPEKSAGYWTATVSKALGAVRGAV
jgi:hypothetical protein